MSEKSGKSQVTTVSPATGEVIVVRGSLAKTLIPPKRETVTPLDKWAGKNPPASNLRDHPELSGKEVTIMQARFQESTLGGKAGTYVIMATYVTNPGVQARPEDFMILMTGSENVQARLADAELAAGEGSPYPLVGILRCSKGGRAWFLD